MEAQFVIEKINFTVSVLISWSIDKTISLKEINPTKNFTYTPHATHIRSIKYLILPIDIAQVFIVIIWLSNNRRYGQSGKISCNKSVKDKVPLQPWVTIGMQRETEISRYKFVYGRPYHRCYSILSTTEWTKATRNEASCSRAQHATRSWNRTYFIPRSNNRIIYAFTINFSYHSTWLMERWMHFMLFGHCILYVPQESQNWND